MKLFNIFINSLLIVLCCFVTAKTEINSIKTDSLPPVLDLKNNPEGMITIKGPSKYEKIEAVAVADINRDGFDDIVATGTLKDGRGNLYAPIIFIIYCSSRLSNQIDMDNPTVQFVSISSEASQLYFDQVKVGDLNGDGLIDIFFKASTKESGITVYKVYVFLGKSNLNSQTSISENTQDLIKISAPGTSVERLDWYYIADMNRDNRDDVVLSYPYKLVQRIDGVGKIYVVYGSSNMPSEINAEKTDLQVKKIEGDTLYQNVISVPGGYNLSQGGFANFAVGDIDRDYKPDIVFDGGRSRLYALMPPNLRDPSMNQGITYLIYGAVLDNAYYLDHLLSLRERLMGLTTFIRRTNLISEKQELNYDLYNKVAVADINADGYDDLFIAYPFKAGTSVGDFEGAGKIFVLYGSRDFIFSGDIDLFKRGVTKIEGAKKGMHIGLNFSFGDVTGDGFNDCLIAGANNTFYILYGRNTFPDSMQISNEFPYGTTIIGGGFACTGDINGDGYKDIIGNIDNKIFVLHGRGKTFNIREAIVKSLSLSNKSRYHFKFLDGSNFHFYFTQGDLYYIPELHLTNLGNHLPDSLQSIPTTQKVVSFIQAELTNMSTLYAYRVQCSIDYTDSALNASSIKEQDLIVSTWNEQNSKWEKLQTTVDTTLNRATFEVEHLSLFALTDKNDSIMADIKENSVSIPLTFELSQNYPNPFNPSTIIKFKIGRLEDLKIIVYNILGQEVKTIISGRLSAGTHEVRWDGTDKFGNKVASGIYIYRMETKSGYVRTRKMVFLK